MGGGSGVAAAGEGQTSDDEEGRAYSLNDPGSEEILELGQIREHDAAHNEQHIPCCKNQYPSNTDRQTHYSAFATRKMMNLSPIPSRIGFLLPILEVIQATKGLKQNCTMTLEAKKTPRVTRSSM